MFAFDDPVVITSTKTINYHFVFKYNELSVSFYSPTSSEITSIFCSDLPGVSKLQVSVLDT